MRSPRGPLSGSDRGRFIVVAGPDGAGKSLLARELKDALSARLETDVDLVNFRSRYVDKLLPRRDAMSLARAASQPHSTPARGYVAATAKALALCADLVCSALLWRR